HEPPGVLSSHGAARLGDRGAVSWHGIQDESGLLQRSGMNNAYIVDGVRTAIGNIGGGLSDVRADDLAALAIQETVRRTGVDPAAVTDVVLGCANQAGEDNRNVARMALLLAGLPVTVPGETVNRLCASGMSAVATAARGAML